jgi:hypothetical protein
MIIRVLCFVVSCFVYSVQYFGSRKQAYARMHASISLHLEIPEVIMKGTCSGSKFPPVNVSELCERHRKIEERATISHQPSDQQRCSIIISQYYTQSLNLLLSIAHLPQKNKSYIHHIYLLFICC